LTSHAAEQRQILAGLFSTDRKSAPEIAAEHDVSIACVCPTR
jgi:hypothetical protein